MTSYLELYKSWLDDTINDVDVDDYTDKVQQAEFNKRLCDERELLGFSPEHASAQVEMVDSKQKFLGRLIDDQCTRYSKMSKGVVVTVVSVLAGTTTRIATKWIDSSLPWDIDGQKDWCSR